MSGDPWPHDDCEPHAWRPVMFADLWTDEPPPAPVHTTAAQAVVGVAVAIAALVGLGVLAAIDTTRRRLHDWWTR